MGELYCNKAVIKKKNLLYLEGVGSSWPRRDIIFIKVLIPIF